MTGHARFCGSVGSAKRVENQRSMTGWKRDSGIRPEIYPKTPLAAQGRHPLDRLADLVVRRRRAGRNANLERAIRQPPLPSLFGGMRADRPIPDAAVRHIDAGRVLDVIRRDFLIANGRKVRGVARVVSADHHHQVERLGDQFEHRVLTFLRRRTDRVEGSEVFSRRGGAPAPPHAFAHFTGDGQRFAREHRGLIRDADALQVAIRIKARGHFAIELLEKLLSRPPSLDVLAHDAGLTHVAHDEIFATGILVDLARGGLRLLVVILAVNPSRAYDSTRFQTLSTDPHVVSTSTHPIARSRSKSLTGTPNAGRITTSFALTELKSNSPSRPSGRCRNCTPIAASF